MIVFQKPLNNQSPRAPLTTPTTTAAATINKYQQIFQSTYPQHAKIANLWQTTHNKLTDINTNSLTRAVVKYLINKTGQLTYVPNTEEYVSLAHAFQTRPRPILNPIPEKLDKLFLELWRETIQEYKLIHGKIPEININPPEYQAIYTKLFNSPLN